MHPGRAAETKGHILEGHIREAFRLSPCDIAADWWMYCMGMAKPQLCAVADAAGKPRLSRDEALRPTAAMLSPILPRPFCPGRCLRLTRSSGASANRAAMAGLALNPALP